MNSNPQKIIINIKDNKYLNWKLCLRNELRQQKSNYLEIDCKDLNLSCTDIIEIIEIANHYNCKIISFCSSSSQTIISSQSLGYRSQFNVEDYSNKNLKKNDQNLDFYYRQREIDHQRRPKRQKKDLP